MTRLTRKPLSSDKPTTDATETASAMAEGSATPGSPMEEADGGADLFANLPTKTRDRYKMGKEVARGGIGKIFEAYDKELHRRVAIKELLWTDGRTNARFLREATITARLEHPSIVPIHETGRWPNGDPFYTMKLIKGRSLKVRIKQAQERKQRLALLPQILAVADAVAYAHSEHIIHRDLKPSNVLIGTYGETVVIDWGLAKDLTADPDGDDSFPVAESSSDDARFAERSTMIAPDPSEQPASSGDLTAVGTVLGTPVYMSPEQARGEAVDMRTDVYAIGAILYHALSGVAPYRGNSSRDILALVCAQPPTPIEERAPDLPADLVAIVTRAIARDPEQRYRDAGELAADLRRFQEGQLVGAHAYSSWQLMRRWIGRRRLAFAVAAVMTTVLVIGAVASIARITNERDRAEEQRKLSEENRAEVEELMAFMLFDLRDGLQPLGKLALLDMVASKASAYFKKRPVDWSQPDDALQRGLAHENLGNVLFARGDLEGAWAERSAALAIYKRLVQIDPENTEWKRELAVGYRQVGAVLRDRGDLDGSQAALRKAHTLIEQLLENDPDNSKWLFDLSESHSQLARLLARRGEIGESLAAHQAGREIREQLVKKDESRTDWQHALSTSHASVGSMLRVLGDAKGGLVHFHIARKIRERELAADPGNVKWMSGLGEIHARIGHALRFVDDIDGALRELQIAVGIRERLTQRDPHNTDWQFELAMVRNLLGDVLRERKDFDGALVQYDAAMATRKRLTEREPENIDWQSELSLSHNMLAKTYLPLGRLDEALDEYRKGLAIRARILARDRSNKKAQREMALSHLGVAKVLQRQNKNDEARTHLKTGAKLYEQFASTMEDFYNTACTFALSGDSDGAFKMLDKAFTAGLRKPGWVKQDPDLASLRSDPRFEILLRKMNDEKAAETGD